MKIIQIIPSLEMAGAEIMCENLSRSLSSMNHEVIVISLFNKSTIISERLLNSGIKVVFLNKTKGFDLKVILKLISIFKKEKPDVIHTHINALIYSTIASIFSKIKCKVHTMHSIANEEATKFKQKLYYFIFKFCKVIPVALSSEVQESIAKRYRLPNEKIPIIYNGVDLSKCTIKNDYSIKGNISFLHIGRFSPVKNHEMLVKVFKKFNDQYPNTELHLVGEGELKNKIMEMVNEFNLNGKVYFEGLQSNVFRYLHNSDIFIFPSIYEGMPMTLIEAMGTGLPIIATNVGGIPTLIKDQINGLLVECEENNLYNAMNLMRNESLRAKLGENAKIESEKFSSINMANNYVKIYEKAIK